MISLIHNFFSFYHLRHAFQTHFREMKVESIPSDLETLLSVEELAKPLSVTYKEFFKKTPQAISRCRERWAVEAPGIQGEDWDDLWTQPFRHLVSARDRLIQFKLLHRSYFTPARLGKIFHTVSAECWRYSLLVLTTFSGGAPTSNNFGRKSLPVYRTLPMAMRVCQLGLVDNVVPSCALRTLLNILLFYGRKAILLNWKKPRAPSVASWKGMVNSRIL